MTERPATFTHIIVGAGSAGCLLANRLSERATNNVLLVEAGGWDRSFWMKLPVGYFKTMTNPRVSHRFATEPHAGVAGRSIEWPRGRVIGGSSSINGLVFIRGQRENYDRWAEL
ncbi:MAG: GMC family oxidoreductase N-terminal domain-containing protein, partial [Hyphomicrobiaceae bacterium]